MYYGAANHAVRDRTQQLREAPNRLQAAKSHLCPRFLRLCHRWLAGVECSSSSTTTSFTTWLSRTTQIQKNYPLRKHKGPKTNIIVTLTRKRIGHNPQPRGLHGGQESDVLNLGVEVSTAPEHAQGAAVPTKNLALSIGFAIVSLPLEKRTVNHHKRQQRRQLFAQDACPYGFLAKKGNFFQIVLACTEFRRFLLVSMIEIA